MEEKYYRSDEFYLNQTKAFVTSYCCTVYNLCYHVETLCMVIYNSFHYQIIICVRSNKARLKHPKISIFLLSKTLKCLLTFYL